MKPRKENTVKSILLFGKSDKISWTAPQTVNSIAKKKARDAIRRLLFEEYQLLWDGEELTL